MQLKILSKRILITIVISEFALFAVLILCFIPKSSIRSDSTLLDSTTPIENIAIPPKQEISIFGLPVRLKIPKINVDAAVENVGLTTKGAMNVPKDSANVGWFELGQRPGEIGSAVIDGHYGVLKNGNGSVFDNLKKLTKGDKLYIEDDKGVIITFVMRESRNYEPDADASDVFSSSDGKAHLNLITCENWDKDSKSYSKRLVVFTDKE